MLGKIAIVILLVQYINKSNERAYNKGRHDQFVKDHWGTEDAMWSMIFDVQKKAEQMAKEIMSK